MLYYAYINLSKGWHNLKKMKNLIQNEAYYKAIVDRAEFIISKMQLPDKRFLIKDELLNYLEIFFAMKNGIFIIYMAVTGCYPTRSDFAIFKQDINVYELAEAVKILANKRNQKFLTRQYLLYGQFLSVENTYLFDVTQTSIAPFVTGIQRVVRRISEKTHKHEIQQFRFQGNLGVLVKTNLEPDIELSSKLEVNSTRASKLIKNLHAFLSVLEKTEFGNLLKLLALPFMRFLKTLIYKIELRTEISHTNLFQNLYVLDKKIILPEIPSLVNTQIYECLLENNFAHLRVILYDFIPLFHTRTVNPKIFLTASEYLRILVYADKIVSISQLVHEQAQLVIEALSLERPEWKSRKREFSYLTLPSGIDSENKNEFIKISNLIVMVGSIEPRKNHVQFFDALEIILRSGKPVIAKIFSSTGWKNDHIIKRIHKLKSSGIDIEVLSVPDNDLRKWIAEAGVLLQISEAEGSGMPVVEALALGTRVIVSDIRPLNELDSEMVTVVPLGDSQALAEEIIRVLGEKSFAETQQIGKVTWEDWVNELISF